MSLNELLSPNPKEWCQLKVKSINFDNSGGLQSPMNYYEEYNHSTQVQGPWGAPQSIFLRLTRVGRTVLCTSLADVSAASPNNLNATLVTVIPERFRPFGGDVRIFCEVINNSSPTLSYCLVSSSGQMTFGNNGSAFTGAGTAGIYVFSGVWTI